MTGMTYDFRQPTADRDGPSDDRLRSRPVTQHLSQTGAGAADGGTLAELRPNAKEVAENTFGRFLSDAVTELGSRHWKGHDLPLR